MWTNSSIPFMWCHGDGSCFFGLSSFSFQNLNFLKTTPPAACWAASTWLTVCLRSSSDNRSVFIRLKNKKQKPKPALWCFLVMHDLTYSTFSTEMQLFVLWSNFWGPLWVQLIREHVTHTLQLDHLSMGKMWFAVWYWLLDFVSSCGICRSLWGIHFNYNVFDMWLVLADLHGDSQTRINLG